MAAGTAYIVFAGGGLILPAQTPYDRQVLREHVLNRAHHKEDLRIDVDRRTWLVDRSDERRKSLCERCKRQITVAALHAPHSTICLCVSCALR